MRERTLLRLGLDLGTNSIGWALYRLGDGAPNRPVELLDGGVSIHRDGREPKSQASNAATRRSKRGPRRNRDRFLLRRRRVAHLLEGLDLLPDDEADRVALRNADPLRLRAEALDRSLAPLELGRVLLSFADRRGFKSNRVADGGEDGKIRKEVSELRRRMAQAGARTLGEYLWRRHQKGKTIRARLGNGLYPDREMISEELEAIRLAQAPYHSEIAAEDWNDVVEALLHQRELRPVPRGRCTLIPSEQRAYKAYPVFQEFRICQEVLNLEVAQPGQGFQRLEPEQARRVVAKLKSVKTQSFDRLFPEARVNFGRAARNGLDGDLTASALRSNKRFGKRLWDGLNLERQQEIVERLLEAEDHADLVKWLKDEFGLDDQHAEAVASTRLPAGTTHLSKAAIERLLPHMREGLPYHEAVQKAELGSHSDLRGDGSRGRLPYYGEVLERDVAGGREDGRTDVERFGRIANPTVHITLGQVRRLFNAIADRYGKPHEVVIELARELKWYATPRRRAATRVAGKKTHLGEAAIRKAIALIATIVSFAAFAQDLTQVCDSNAPTNTEYWNTPKDYADNFCALWKYERHKALNQLGKMLETNRERTNAARIYFNPKHRPNAEYIQLRRPWMDGMKVAFFEAVDKNTRYVCVEDKSCYRVKVEQMHIAFLIQI